MCTNDKDLILKLKNGDEQSFTIIYKKYYKSILLFSLKNLKSKEDAEEIVQNLFLKIWLRRHELNEELNFKSYLFQIAINDIYNRYKKSIVESSYFEYSLKNKLYDDGSIEEMLESKDILGQVKRKIENLPPQRKLVIKLNKIEGLSTKEISQKLNVSVRTIENHVFRGVAYLRNEMKYCLEY